MSHPKNPGDPLGRNLYAVTLELSGDVEGRGDDLLRLGLYDALRDRAAGTWRGTFDRAGRSRDEAAEELVREVEAVPGVRVVRVLDS